MRKNLGKLVLLALGIGAVVAVAKGVTSYVGEVVAEGSYENKGKYARWQITESNGVYTAYVQFPGSGWTEIATQGTMEALGQLIDSRMRENGYLPSGVGMTQGGGVQQAGVSIAG